MNISDIITQVRLDSWLDNIQAPDTNILIWINRVYRDLINDITQKVNEDFFYQEWTTNLVNNQREYTLQKRTSTIDWLKKVKKVSLKVNNEFINVRPNFLSTSLEKDLWYYSINQNINDPFYIISDNSIFIYPTPKENITNWLKIYWICDPIDLTLTSTEENIKIPLEYQDLLVLWAVYHSYRSRQMINEKNEAKNEYIFEKNKMLTNLSDRIITPLVSEMPYINNLS